MRILVTGGAGFIGSHIVDACIAAGHEVGVLDNLSSGFKININKSANLVVKDLQDRYSADLMKVFQPDVICHQAAQPSLRKSIDDPMFDATVNILGALNVIQAAKEVNAHIVFASTSAVYDPSGQLPYLEADCIKPHLPYGIAKATAERYIADSGLTHTILRYGNVYGPRQVEVGENQLIPHCLNYLLRDKPFVINGDGEQTRDFIYVGDIARANMMAIESRPQGIFNCGSGVATKVTDICWELADTHDRRAVIDGNVDYKFGPMKEGEVKHSLLNSRKAFDVFGWKAETSLEDGLRKTYEWAKAQ